MKKFYLMLAVALVSVSCLAQKSNVNQAKSISGQLESPDFAKARQLMAAALQDESTKNLTNTWYVAGLIGYNEMKYNEQQAQFGMPMDEMKVFMAVNESYDYWLKADEMSQVPNAKGKVDQKTRKNIADRMVEYYKKYLLANYALEMNNAKDYQQAYQLMQKHYSIPTLDMMQTDKLQQNFVKDTTYYIYYYYMGRFAYEAKLYSEAVSIFETMESDEARQIARDKDVMYSLEFLAMCRLEMKDTVAYIDVMKQGIERYPEEEWFTANLINHFIFSNKYDEAIEYLNKLIDANPNVAQYYLAMGDLHERQEKLTEATVDYEKVIALDPNNANAWAGKGRCVYNEAVKLNEQAADISDMKLYNQKLQEMNAKFAESLPYFEKAHELDKENRTTMITLKGLYYRLKMQKEYDAINAEINGD